MTQVMKGVRVLEVAQFTFVPAAGAILADWGAEVVKIEHPVRGDTQRGFLNVGGGPIDPERHTLMQHPNRGKLSVGLDIATPEGQELLYEIAKTCDVFLTNFLPAVRQKNRFDLEHIRAANPDIIYARGSALGEKGDEREIGGFDGTIFWSRSGIANTFTPPELDGPLNQAIPAFGDSIGGMFIAGGISAALYHRARTGEATEVDVSLQSTAWWAAGAAMTQELEYGNAVRNMMPRSGGAPINPFLGNFKTSDGGFINLCIITPGPVVRDTFAHLGLPEAGEDPRFQDLKGLIANAAEVSELIVKAIGARPFAYWREHLRTMKGQWTPVQSLKDMIGDEQALANDMIVEVEMDAGAPMKLVRGPVQFDREPLATVRAPNAFEHTETFLMGMGIEWDRIEALKAAKAIS